MQLSIFCSNGRKIKQLFMKLTLLMIFFLLTFNFKKINQLLI